MLTLLPFLAAAGLWGRSQWMNDSFELVVYRPTVAHLVLQSERGRLSLYASFSTAENFSFGKSRNVRGFTWRSGAADATEHSSWSNWRDFLDRNFGYQHFADIPPSPQYSDYYFMAPHWLFVVLGGVVPFIWMLRRCRHAPNCCITCGYDLRATPDKCPECGTDVTITKVVSG